MDLENLRLILSLLAPALGLLCTTVIVLQKLVKNQKLKRILEKTEEITKQIIPCIIEAEKNLHYTGEKKKKMVMTKLNQYAIEKHLGFDEAAISQKIEQYIDLTKQVNSKKSEEAFEEDKSIEEQIQKRIEELRR